MSTLRRVYDTNYSISIDGVVYAPTKTGKLRKLKPTWVENKSPEKCYVHVVLKIAEQDNEHEADDYEHVPDKEKRKRFAIKKLVADHFPIRVRTSKTSMLLPYAESAEQLSDVNQADIYHIDGDEYNCSAKNLYYCAEGSKGADAEKPSQAALYKPIFEISEAEYDVQPLADVLGYVATTDGRILSNLRKNQAEIKPFFNNEHDKHLSVMLTIASGDKHRFCLPDQIIKAFKKGSNELDNYPYKIFYKDGNNKNCALTNLIAAYRIPDEEIRAIRRQLVGKSYEDAKLILASYGVIEN